MVRAPRALLCTMVTMLMMGGDLQPGCLADQHAPCPQGVALYNGYNGYDGG